MLDKSGPKIVLYETSTSMRGFHAAENIYIGRRLRDVFRGGSLSDGPQQRRPGALWAAPAGSGVLLVSGDKSDTTQPRSTPQVVSAQKELLVATSSSRPFP